MSDKRWIYWTLQVLGWGAIFSLSILGDYLDDGSIHPSTVQQTILMLVSAVFITNTYRQIVLKKKWLNLAIDKTVYLVLISSTVLSLTLIGANQILNVFYEEPGLNVKTFLAAFVVYFILTTIWNVVYFAYHFFEKSRKHEMKTLQLESTQKESELLNLKNQLKPHFMFNAMNSIRALVDDDPDLAKKSITQLSNLLRNTLQFGKRELITLKEELQIVNDYLALEKIRFEERLMYQQQIDESLNQTTLPPLLIQTLIENAIKHGVSKKTEGGEVSLEVLKEDKRLVINIKNVGEYNPANGTNSGIGLENARKRLQILYGKNVEFKIGNVNNQVLTQVKIPVST